VTKTMTVPCPPKRGNSTDQLDQATQPPVVLRLIRQTTRGSTVTRAASPAKRSSRPALPERDALTHGPACGREAAAPSQDVSQGARRAIRLRVFFLTPLSRLCASRLSADRSGQTHALKLSATRVRADRSERGGPLRRI
jgi:hypothetical protein